MAITTHTPVICDCSDYQLAQVGCECGAERALQVEVRSDSYGVAPGPHYFRCSASDDVRQLAVEKFGMLVRVVNIVDLDEQQLQRAIAANRLALGGPTYEQLQATFGVDNS